MTMTSRTAAAEKVSPQSNASTTLSCHIFWDLDNVQPTHVEDIPVIGHAIRTALMDLLAQIASPCTPSTKPPLPPSPPPLTVFANPTTLQKFSPIITDTSKTSTLDLHQAVVDILGGNLILTTGRKQSVDFAMKSAMLEYFQEERKKVKESGNIIVACVSDDTDYVQVLSYLGGSINYNQSNKNNSSSPAIILCSSTGGGSGDVNIKTSTISSNTSDATTKHDITTQNTTSTNTVPIVSCRTVSIGEHKRRKRPAWAAPRKLDSLALPAACDAALTLSRPRVRNENSGATAVGMLTTKTEWRVESVWVNPKRNWKERIKEIH